MPALLIISFLLLVAAASTATYRGGKRRVPRHVALAAAGILAFACFGYTLGKDLAVRDNAAACHAPAGSVETSGPGLPAGDSAAT